MGGIQRSGVGQGSMYHHFQGEPDLVLAAEQRSTAQLQQQVRDTFAGPGSAYQRIREYLPRERDVLRGCSVGRLTADPEVMSPWSCSEWACPAPNSTE